MHRFAITPQKRIDALIGMRSLARMPGSGETHKVLPAYAWPGGYPITYYDGENEPLCPTCASRALDQFLQDRIDAACDGYLMDTYFDVPQYHDVYYEGPDVLCSDCNRALESAYGDPFEDD